MTHITVLECAVYLACVLQLWWDAALRVMSCWLQVLLGIAAVCCASEFSTVLALLLYVAVTAAWE